MNLQYSHIKSIVKSEMTGVDTLNEELSPDEIEKLREMIRREMSFVFFQLFKKRSVWI